ncbi:MAG: HAMP domain-containing histidine kinase [Leptospiraceae bacterium]|nr:HAMP domain-containing histidine kinase [Leptospiraceae bacterium]MCP5512271.1 HAMP domain-containing histidine kinase [Leptospiraceae bacterium]
MQETEQPVPDPDFVDELESIFDSINEPIIFIDNTFVVRRINHASKDFFRPNLPPIQESQKCYEFLYGRVHICPYCPFYNFPKTFHNSEYMIDLKSLVSSGFSTQILSRVEGKNENLELSFFPVIHKGQKIGFVEKIRNITQIRDNEEENLRMRNLASLGIMVSGVAHELNNPLTGISLTLQNLMKNIKVYNNEQLQERLSLIQNDLHRASNIVSDIISFAKPEKIKLTYSDIMETISKARETVQRLYPTLSESVVWDLTHENDNFFYFNPLKMERLFINLFRNSIQAIDYRPGRINVFIKRKKNNCQIVVEDNGGGISDQIIDKIFDPFFTKKESGQGTGLGLSICHSIVKEHLGKISVKSFEGKTRFIITLPYGNKNR